MTDICKFIFNKEVDKQTIEEDMALAIITAECIFGQARVRLNAGYLASSNKVVIETSCEVGEHVARVFTGLISRDIGENKFTVERIKRETLNHEGC